MAGIDDNVAFIGDLAPLNPSPRIFFSSLLGDDFSSRPLLDLQQENGKKAMISGSEKLKGVENTQNDDKIGCGVSSDPLMESNPFSGQKLDSRGGLAQRMAARAGFNAPKLNTARIRSANLLSSASPEVWSPYLTIPPGLSPTTLLESPIFLPNSLVQPSPTTGKFPSASCDMRTVSLSAAQDNNEDLPLEEVDAASFVFKPCTNSNFSYFPSSMDKVASTQNGQQTLPSIEASVQSDHANGSQRLRATETNAQNREEFHQHEDSPEMSIGKDGIVNIPLDSRTSDRSPPSDLQELEGDQREVPSLAISAPSDDGYNWRKYGQKQVKGSEFPRSYYKCTHLNCQVKKKVERSQEGRITEIIYKGSHNHPKPPPSRRFIGGSSNFPGDMDVAVQHGAPVNAEPLWVGMQNGNAAAGSDGKHDAMETATSASITTEFYDQANSMVTKNAPHIESGDAIDVSSTPSNDDEDDRATHGSTSLGHDDDGDESESKRRKVETSAMEMSGATRAVREPRVVVQTTSEVDILDDGYRWRKYGQKVVKGNPNPRSYYKCTNPGCSVRKHIERASHDLKSVITTYEGKHNHDVPAARNSSHISSMAATAAPAPVIQPHIIRPEPSQPRNGTGRLECPTPLDTFGLAGRQTVGPEPGFSLGMNHTNLASITVASLGPGQGKSISLPIHSYLGQQKADEARQFMPKGEPREEPMLQSGLSSGNGPSMYHHIMNRLPLGPSM